MASKRVLHCDRGQLVEAFHTPIEGRVDVEAREIARGERDRGGLLGGAVAGGLGVVPHARTHSVSY